jgi:NADPH:quinone reductase-like Zn-dependent oxidoreductase
MSSALSNLPKVMRAVLQPDTTSHKLIMATTQPVPTPKHPEDVLVKVHATSPCLGELDWALWAPDFIGDDKTPIPGQDVTGTVVQSNSGSFHPGDAVYCRITANRPGGAAEYTLARATELALKPRTLSWADAAATPLSALTAYQALFEQGTLSTDGLPGAGGSTEDNEEKKKKKRDAARARNAAQRILITAAAGSVGGWAVQLARLAGAGSIVAVCGSDNSAAAARALGATEIVDYTASGGVSAWAAASPAAREVDLVVDCAGGETLAGCWGAVRAGGTLVSICQSPDEVRPADVGAEKREGVRTLWFVVESRGRDLDIISRLLELGGCRPLVDSVVGFDDFERAWDKVEGRHAKGKVVVLVDGRD